MEENKQLYIINADNTRQLLQKANNLSIKKEEIVTVLSPEYKGGTYKLMYYR